MKIGKLGSEKLSKQIISVDNFFLKITPAWFNFLEYLIVIGLLGYLYKKTDSGWILLMYILSCVFMLFYLQSLLLNLDYFRKNNLLKNNRKNALLLMVLIVVVFLMAYIISITVGQFSLIN